MKLNNREIEYIMDNEPEEDLWYCFFSTHKSENEDRLFHKEGECMKCDWERQSLSAKDWDDPNFIEAWDYKEYWNKNIKKI